jgi:hypothetical protein
VLYEALIILFNFPYIFLGGYILQVSLLSGVKNSFDIPMFDIGRSDTFFDVSSGTKHIEALGSASLPKVISMLIL